MNKKPNILITNDDGIKAPGLTLLQECLKKVANLYIVAPKEEQRLVGLATTTQSPLQINKLASQTWSIDGTPVDCVKLALSNLLEEKPDLIISGINRGSNAGRILLYSGTVAAAIEGTVQGVNSLAISCYDYENPDYNTAAAYAQKLVLYALGHPPPPGIFLNINFPTRKQKISGFKLTKNGLSYWKESPSKHQHPTEGHSYYWLGAKAADFPEEEDCDVQWLDHGYVTAVPININQLADHDHLNDQRHLFEDFFDDHANQDD